jgi:hypothetical protein
MTGSQLNNLIAPRDEKWVWHDDEGASGEFVGGTLPPLPVSL